MWGCGGDSVQCSLLLVKFHGYLDKSPRHMSKDNALTGCIKTANSTVLPYTLFLYLHITFWWGWHTETCACICGLHPCEEPLRIGEEVAYTCCEVPLVLLWGTWLSIFKVILYQLLYLAHAWDPLLLGKPHLVVCGHSHPSMDVSDMGDS